MDKRLHRFETGTLLHESGKIYIYAVLELVAQKE